MTAKTEQGMKRWNGKMRDYLRVNGDRLPDLLFPRVLRSHEPPRNSGEGTAVNGPMPLAGGDERRTPAGE